MKRFNRNDTSFPVKLAEYIKSIRSDKTYPFLKYYQNIVRIMFSADLGTRGLLVNHEMGLGKSILAVAAAIDMMPERQPIILLAKSLAENMRSSIVKYVRMRAKYDEEWPIGRFTDSELDDWISANFSFVSMNASNMLSQISRAVSLDKKIGDILEQVSSLDGKLLIVDEAHNLFRAIVNGSKNGLGLYNLVQKSKNLKILFLTGTPIANDPFELVPCFNMLGGSVLPEDYIEFNRLYVDNDGRIKNRNKFQNRLFGLISSVKHVSLDVNEPRGEFPERLPIITVRVRMDHVQYTSYSLAREREREEGSKPGARSNARVAMVKPKSRGASTYRVKSRQISNFDMPADMTLEEIKNVTSPKFVAIHENIKKHEGQKGLVYSQFVGNGGLAPFRKFLQSRGWTEIVIGDTIETNEVDTNEVDTNEADTNEADTNEVTKKPIVGGLGTAALPSAIEYIESMVHGAGEIAEGWWLDADSAVGGAVDRIKYYEYIPPLFNDEMSGGKGQENSQQNEEEPLMDISTALETYNIDTGEKNGSGGLQYVVISGQVSVEDRTKVQEIFNTPGGCSLILVSSTGAEGLDLKRVRHIHIMEPYWNWGRVEQIIFRGVRNDSHIDLPQDQKNVQAYIYLAVVPESEESKGEITTDVELYEDALKNRDSIDSFLIAMDEVSIECSIGGKNCKTCNPTSEPLFTNDPAKDIRTRDPCTQYEEAELQVSEINIDGVTYQYAQSKDSIYGIKIFKFDEEIGAYRQIKESNPIYQRVYSEIESE